jgi:hypothetical protein
MNAYPFSKSAERSGASSMLLASKRPSGVGKKSVSTRLDELHDLLSIIQTLQHVLRPRIHDAAVKWWRRGTLALTTHRARRRRLPWRSGK